VGVGWLLSGLFVGVMYWAWLVVMVVRVLRAWLGALLGVLGGLLGLGFVVWMFVVEGGGGIGRWFW